MIIDIPSYKHIVQDQEVDLSTNNIRTLIGGNGAGKSTLLESIFSNYIDVENGIRDRYSNAVDGIDDEENNEESPISILNSTRCIVFSSGQNELFSNIFNNYDKNVRRYNRHDNQTVKSFYFDYWWSRLLIFFATSLKTEGYVRNYLRDKNYVEENITIDTSSKLKFSLRMRKPLIDKIYDELEKEGRGEYIENPLYRSLYIRHLEKLINHTMNKNYDFTDTDTLERIVSTSVEFAANDVNDVLGNNINEIFTFISRASSSWLSNFELENFELYFKDNRKLEQLSDGEYQLLTLYSMIDLFDNENTIFLFDEVDSHLHYTNLNKLWDILGSVNGKVITTTHISESILNNSFETISYIDNGKIENSLTAREVFKRVSNIVGEKNYEYKIGAKVENIALLDDEVDWLIFKKLAIKKIGQNAINTLEKVVPYKRSSSFNTTGEIFGKSKLKFVEDFKEQNMGRAIITKNIFLICDRDKLPLTEINNDLSVNIDREYNDIKSFNSNNTKTYLSSWKMLEIENYLLSRTMLEYYNKFEDFKNELLSVNFDGISSFDESEDICIYDAKAILHPLYKNGGFDEVKLDEIIDKIPTNEISDDIVKMYNFIEDKI